MATPWTETDIINLGSVQISKREDGKEIFCACLVEPGSQKPMWFPINKLTASGWVQMKDGLLELLDSQEKRSKIKYEELTDLYDLVPYNDRKAYLNKHGDGVLANECCSVCCKYSPPLKKCMYSDCSGLCDTCYTSNMEKSPGVCLACEREQNITCPICQEDHNKNNMVKSENCEHHVCWKCYGLAFKANRPIYSCPMCRCEFTKRDEEKEEEAVAFNIGDLMPDVGEVLAVNDNFIDQALNLSDVEMAMLMGD